MVKKTRKHSGQRAQTLQELEKVQELYRRLMEMGRMPFLPVIRPHPRKYVPPRTGNPLPGKISGK